MSNESVIARYSPQRVTLTAVYSATFWTLIGIGLTTLFSGLTLMSLFSVPPTPLIGVAVWCVTAAMLLRGVIQWWNQGAQYVITNERVVWQRGRFSRSIVRSGISFARIHWIDRSKHLGDLELVREVREGVFKRKLTVMLPGLIHPERVWETIRSGAVCSGDDELPARPVGQRLLAGERLLWTERPNDLATQRMAPTWRSVGTLLFATTIIVVGLRGGLLMWTAAHRAVEAGLSLQSVGFFGLIASTLTSTALLIGLGIAVAWVTLIQPRVAQRNTQYLITDRQILIAQGDDELLMDRSKIVDVIDNPENDGRHTLFLVVRGSRPTSDVAVSGAFDTQTRDSLLPVLFNVIDVEHAQEALRPAPGLKAAALFYFFGADGVFVGCEELPARCLLGSTGSSGKPSERLSTLIF